MQSNIGATAVALLALVSLARPVAAQNLDLSEMAAALALPVITDAATATHTSIIVTNTSANTVVLGFEVLSGDPLDNWSSNSFICLVTGNETTEIYITPDGAGGSLLSFECSASDADQHSPLGDLNIPRVEPAAAGKGILWVYTANLAGTVTSNNVLVGDATIINYSTGQAWSAGAIPFQGKDAFAQSGDQTFRFDGLEYAKFPSLLTTNFHAPTDGIGGGVDAALVLFTLDGSTGGIGSPTPTPAAMVSVDFFNDDERLRDTALTFDCFTIIELSALDARFIRSNLGSRIGHMQLRPQPVARNDLAHDQLFDAGTLSFGVRTAPVHGWIFQEIWDFNLSTDFDKDGLTPIASPAAFARTLGQGVFALTPSPGDTPTFNAQ
jgi:hypothetical protein